MLFGLCCANVPVLLLNDPLSWRLYVELNSGFDANSIEEIIRVTIQ